MKYLRMPPDLQLNGGEMQLVTATEASQYLNIRVQRLYELVRQRSVPYIKLGARQLRFDLDELAHWARRGGVDGVPLEGAKRQSTLESDAPGNQ